MRYELISFKLCPFVQRSLITLLHKDIEHSITYIELDDPPRWFLDISPLGKVPALRIDERTTLFESAVINEFIDETTPGALHPGDPLERARNRAWIEFGQTLLGHHYNLVYADTTERQQRAHQGLQKGLARLEREFEGVPFFNGDKLSLIDTAYAPLWMHIQTINELTPEPSLDMSPYPRLRGWSDALLALDEVQRSVVPEFASLYRERILKRQPLLAAQIEQP